MVEALAAGPTGHIGGQDQDDAEDYGHHVRGEPCRGRSPAERPMVVAISKNMPMRMFE